MVLHIDGSEILHQMENSHNLNHQIFLKKSQVVTLPETDIAPENRPPQ